MDEQSKGSSKEGQREANVTHFTEFCVSEDIIRFCFLTLTLYS